MNAEDRRMQTDERDASPERFFAQETSRPAERAVAGTEPVGGKEQVEQPVLSRTRTGESSISSVSSVQRESMRISRMATQTDDVDLHRHPTALSRIATGRSQHSHTVGTSLRSRMSRKQSTALPNFGGGKPYPPELPAQEEYVVEFDGPKDPIHAQVSDNGIGVGSWLM